MSEEKSKEWAIRDEYCIRIQKAFENMGCGCDCEDIPSILVDFEKVIKSEQKAEIERLKINLVNEKKWGKIQAKQSEKETARDILGEIDLFFKGTTFRQGYEFKKIIEKLKEMAKKYGVEVDYEN